MSIIAKRLMDRCPPCAGCAARCPAAVDSAITRALAKVPADRFPPIGEFAAALVAPGAAATARAHRRVAVLPFRNLSADPENEYFADGITEDVIAHLSKIRALKVISRNSVMPFKQREQSLREIGAALGATALLDGSVRRAGDRVRIVAQLIDARVRPAPLGRDVRPRARPTSSPSRPTSRCTSPPRSRPSCRARSRRACEKEPTHDLQAYQLFLQGRQ